MEITQVKVFPVEEEKLKAYVSIVLDECFLVSDLKVIHGPNGLFISMPSKRKKNGEFKDIAHPLNRETREQMERRILDEYERTRAQMPLAPPPPAASPSEVAEPTGDYVSPVLRRRDSQTRSAAERKTSCAPGRESRTRAWGVAKSGKAPAFGAGIWRFESSRPSQHVASLRTSAGSVSSRDQLSAPP